MTNTTSNETRGYKLLLPGDNLMYLPLAASAGAAAAATAAPPPDGTDASFSRPKIKEKYTCKQHGYATLPQGSRPKKYPSSWEPIEIL